MPLPSERPFKWRHSPDSPITVSAAAFARLVAENDITPIETGGYLWAWLPTADGHDAYRTFKSYDGVLLTVTTGTDAVAGANPANMAVPTATNWNVVAIYAKVVNDANVANRALTLSIYDAAGRLMGQFSGGTLTAGQTGYMSFISGQFTDDTTGTEQQIHLPAELVSNMPAGWYFGFVYTNKQAGDDFEAVVIHHQAVSAV